MMYLWLKALHVASILLFTGGLLALALVISGSSKLAGVALPHEKSIARTMLRWDGRVTIPALLASWGLGLSLAFMGGWMGQAWLMMKLVLVVLLSGLHGVLRGCLKRRLDGLALPSLSWQGGASILAIAAMAAIALLVVIKPFHEGILH